MLEDWLTPSHFVMLGMLFVFALVHSGLAALRPWGESKIGARPYRVLFAVASIPLAVGLVAYFVAHRYDGMQLWMVQGISGIEPLVWGLSFVSFLFLYPATFNLGEIAAIAKPEVHLYETGIIRICRHPQMVGQVIWCIAHTLWIGTSFTLVTSLGLIAHHLFAVWHGDRRLAARFGKSFETLRSRTSIVPFLAIVRGQQTLNWQEFVRPAYLGVVIFVLGFWFAHPWLIRVTGNIPW